MKIKKHYEFDTRNQGGPSVTAYRKDEIGLWSMDLDDGWEIRVVMTPAQATQVGLNLIRAAEKARTM